MVYYLWNKFYFIWLSSCFLFGFFLSSERIPAKSTLLFDVELINIENGEKIPNVFRLIDINGDQLLSRDEVSIFSLSLSLYIYIYIYI